MVPQSHRQAHRASPRRLPSLPMTESMPNRRSVMSLTSMLFLILQIELATSDSALPPGGRRRNKKEASEGTGRRSDCHPSRSLGLDMIDPGASRLPRTSGGGISEGFRRSEEARAARDSSVAQRIERFTNGRSRVRIPSDRVLRFPIHEIGHNQGLRDLRNNSPRLCGDPAPAHSEEDPHETRAFRAAPAGPARGVPPSR